MYIYHKNNIVIATHTDDQAIDTATYGDDVKRMWVPNDVDLAQDEETGTINVPDLATMPAEVVAKAINAAKADVITFADDLAEKITGPVPASEKLAWTKKEEAARAFLGGTHTPAQEALLQGELDMTGQMDGNDITTLANKIVAKADFYAIAVGKIAGLRRATMAAIDALGDTPSQDELDTVMEAAKGQAETEFAALMANAPA